MIFRDLIPEEEFIIGEMVYYTARKINLPLYAVYVNEQFTLECAGFWFTKNGLYYDISDTIYDEVYDKVEDWCKDVITSNMDRIFPIKYKPL
jgi:hypothetical protein